MGRGLTAEQVRDRLGKACEDAGSQAAWARAHGYSPQWVCDVLSGRREISEALANSIGLIRRIAYYPLR
jgi:hypothetical protein